VISFILLVACLLTGCIDAPATQRTRFFFAHTEQFEQLGNVLQPVGGRKWELAKSEQTTVDTLLRALGIQNYFFNDGCALHFMTYSANVSTEYWIEKGYAYLCQPPADPDRLLEDIDSEGIPAVPTETHYVYQHLQGHWYLFSHLLFRLD